MTPENQRNKINYFTTRYLKISEQKNLLKTYYKPLNYSGGVGNVRKKPETNPRFQYKIPLN